MTKLIIVLAFLAFACPAARRAGRRAKEAFEAFAEPAVEYAEEQARRVCEYVTAAFVDGQPGEGAAFCYE